jgi:hypothetical protein
MEIPYLFRENPLGFSLKRLEVGVVTPIGVIAPFFL